MSLVSRAHDLFRVSDRANRRPADRTGDAEAELLPVHQPGAPASPAAVLRLQQTHGNHFVQRLLQRESAAGECPDGGCG